MNPFATASLQVLVVLAGALGVVSATTAEAACTVRPVDGHDVTICAAKSTAGKELRLTLDAAPVTMDTVAAKLCADPAARLTLASLWMPDHGHGSSPTRLVARADGCTDILDIDFTMPGRWQIRLRFSDGDRGVVETMVK